MDQFKKVIHKKNTEIGSLKRRLAKAEQERNFWKKSCEDTEFLLAKSENDLLMMQPMPRDGIISKDDALDALSYACNPITLGLIPVVDAEVWDVNAAIDQAAKNIVSHDMEVPKEYLENKNKNGVDLNDKKPPYFDLDD